MYCNVSQCFDKNNEETGRGVPLKISVPAVDHRSI